MANQMCSEKPCPLSKVISWLSFAVIAFLVLIAIGNWQQIELHLYNSASLVVPVGLLVLVSIVVGFFAGISDYVSARRGAKQDQIKEQWQVQDAKLAASITSDREKQLEAKIATLETALEKALKK